MDLATLMSLLEMDCLSVSLKKLDRAAECNYEKRPRVHCKICGTSDHVVESVRTRSAVQHVHHRGPIDSADTG